MLRRQHKYSRDLLLLVPCPIALEMTVGLSGFHTMTKISMESVSAAELPVVESVSAAELPVERLLWNGPFL